jgi:hypothetical protein
LTWLQPDTGGSDITIQILFKPSVGNFAEVTSMCNASLQSVIDSRTCTFTFSQVIASPLSLSRGDLILARLKITSAEGTAESGDSENTVEVEAPPDPPSDPPEVSSYNEFEMTIVTPEITCTDCGENIISYALYWNRGSGDEYTSVIDINTMNTNRQFLLTGLTAGAFYKYKYKVMNNQGWSDFSDDLLNVLEQQAIGFPGKPVYPISTSMVGPNVRLSWVEPYKAGSDITGYEIQIKNKAGQPSPSTSCNGSNSLIKLQRY